jgi:ATP-dependent DNA helicase RecG
MPLAGAAPRLRVENGATGSNVVAYLEKFGEASRADIDDLLLNKLSDALSMAQRRQFIKNLLQEMKTDGVIQPGGGRRWAKWRLCLNPRKLR